MVSFTRREFNTLLMTGAALSVLPGCSPFAGTVSLTNGQAVLPFSQFPALRSAGGSVVVDVQDSFPLVIVRTSDAAATALSATCTHAGCILHFDTTRGDIHCDCHNADFTLAGEIIDGPARVPLPVYATVIDTSGITVTVTG